MDTGEISLIRSQNVLNNFFSRDGRVYLTKQHADELRNVEVFSGDVLLNITGDSVARCCQVPDDVLPARVNQHVAILRPMPGVLDSRYLKYFLVSPGMQEYMLGLAAAGATRNALTKGMIEGFRIPKRTSSEQLRIAEILGSLDDKIELNRLTNETLEAMARTLFRSWFVDFDPVRAKADGQQPQGMHAATAKLFPDSFEPSALGPIPKGWRVGKLEEVAEIVMGSSPAGDTYNEVGTGMPLVNGPVEFGEYFAVKRKWTTEPGRLSKPNDLIFCVRGSTTGRRVVADDVYCLGRGVCSIRSRSGTWAFIHRLIDFSLDRLLSRVSGSVFPNLNGPDLKQFEVVIPNDQIITAYQRHAQPWMEIIATRVRESESLACIRDALMPRLLSGEVRVGDVEQVDSAAVTRS